MWGLGVGVFYCLFDYLALFVGIIFFIQLHLKDRHVKLNNVCWKFCFNLFFSRSINRIPRAGIATSELCVALDLATST